MKQLSNIFDALNMEKAVFLATSVFLLYAGYQYQSVPDVKSWETLRAERMPSRIAPLDLSEPSPVTEFLRASRISPFTESTNIKVVREPLVRYPRRRVTTTNNTENVVGANDGNDKPKLPPIKPDSKDVPKDDPIGEITLTKRDPINVPVRVMGILRVDNGGKYAMFKSLDDDKRYTLGKGDMIPGTELRVIIVTNNFVVVETKDGKRIRLDEILKHSSGKQE